MQDSQIQADSDAAPIAPSGEDPWMRWLQHVPGETAEPEFTGVRSRISGWLVVCVAGVGFWVIAAIMAGSLLV